MNTNLQHLSPELQGDSGGPFVVQNQDKSYSLAGVVSWGEVGDYSVFTRVSSMKGWIEKTFLENDANAIEENLSWPEKMELEDMVKAIGNMKDHERKEKSCKLAE